jgi:hypothetical protein
MSENARISVLESKVERIEMVVTSIQDVISGNAELNQKLININDKFVTYQKERATENDRITKATEDKDRVVLKMGKDIHIIMRIVFMVTGGLTFMGVVAPFAVRYMLK